MIVIEEVHNLPDNEMLLSEFVIREIRIPHKLRGKKWNEPVSGRNINICNTLGTRRQYHMTHKRFMGLLDQLPVVKNEKAHKLRNPHLFGLKHKKGDWKKAYHLVMKDHIEASREIVRIFLNMKVVTDVGETNIGTLFTGFASKKFLSSSQLYYLTTQGGIEDYLCDLFSKLLYDYSNYDPTE